MKKDIRIIAGIIIGIVMTVAWFKLKDSGAKVYTVRSVQSHYAYENTNSQTKLIVYIKGETGHVMEVFCGFPPGFRLTQEDRLLTGLDQHIKNLNFALNETTFNFYEGLNIKDYASITKDLVQAATLYQAIADAHRPDSEVKFDLLPAVESQQQTIEGNKLPNPAEQKSLPSPDAEDENGKNDEAGND